MIAEAVRWAIFTIGSPKCVFFCSRYWRFLSHNNFLTLSQYAFIDNDAVAPEEFNIDRFSGPSILD